MLEVSWTFVLGAEEAVGDQLASLPRRTWNLLVIRRQRMRPHIFKDVLILSWSTARRESPHDLVPIVDVDVIANYDDAVDQHAALVLECQLADALAEQFRACAHLA